ncbi:hypothetical protein [Streptomyces sp. NPDC048411]|uniref:hypothetical protein n=1 Tax=Streptomyces sp. NPDC048411 TaxID=3157206 RepID=UPI00345516A1
MSEHSKFLEPITRENVAVVLVDHQVGLLSGVRDIPLGELKQNVVALARGATVLGIPLVVTTTAADSMWGPTAAELVQALRPDSGSSTAALSTPGMTTGSAKPSRPPTGRS